MTMISLSFFRSSHYMLFFKKKINNLLHEACRQAVADTLYLFIIARQN